MDTLPRDTMPQLRKELSDVKCQCEQLEAENQKLKAALDIERDLNDELASRFICRRCGATSYYT